ncbi:MAG: HAD family acid phosphatase [Candidatus Eremiobacterota bacterium]
MARLGQRAHQLMRSLAAPLAARLAAPLAAPLAARWLLLLWLALPLPLWAEDAPASLAIPNLTVVKQQVRDWVASGRYQAECASVNAQARAYLEANLARAARPALVLDIDETSLSNYPLWDRCDFGWDPERWDRWVANGQTPAIPSTLELYRFARSRGVACFFITGRAEPLREATERDLRNAGYEGWAGLHLKPLSYDAPSVVGFKSGVRKQLTEQGYTILVNVGDQMSDLDGGYADGAFKLPNPMYYIP